MKVRIANFEKISEEQYIKDFKDIFFTEDDIENGEALIESVKSIYQLIMTPCRATSESAGYDFFSPLGFELQPGESIKLPTGIRCKMDEGWVLKIYPRSSIGFKYGVMLTNTVGIIDGDYYYADNEGHIILNLVNHGDKVWKVEADNKICQGVFVPYGITYDGDVDATRDGGMGSTGE